MAKIKHERPPEVVRAILKNDRFALSAMGRKGALVANKRRQDKEEILALLAQEAREEGFQSLAKQANEHICPIESSDRWAFLFIIYFYITFMPLICF